MFVCRRSCARSYKPYSVFDTDVFTNCCWSSVKLAAETGGSLAAHVSVVRMRFVDIGVHLWGCAGGEEERGPNERAKAQDNIPD